MNNKFTLPLETPNKLFGLYLYPGAKEIMEQQQDVFWTAQEIKVEKDIHDYRSRMSKEQYNLVTITLQLFVEIEQKVGDVWNEIASWFPHSEIEGACMQMASMEKSVHAFFYQKMSDVLNINPEEIAANQEKIAVLKSKLEFLQKITSELDKDKPLSLATVAMIEQVLLFSNFAMLKSFKANGNNLIPNTITGVDFVVNDELFHGHLASYLYRTYLDEYKQLWKMDYDVGKHIYEIRAVLDEIIEHEDAVIDYTFSGELPINGITGDMLKDFIRARGNEVLESLGYSPRYVISNNSIGEWFYKGINSIKLHDFFATSTNSYRRGWSFDGFSRTILKESNE